MLAPLSWLKDYVEIDIPAKELEKKLFGAGFEVEEIIEPGKEITGVVTGKVEECELIPDTHIHVCRVNCGEKGTFQICCGADNVKVGGVYPVALPGATVFATAKDHVTIEGVMTIKVGKLRGVESQGMLCSGVEIGLNEDLYPGAGYCGLLVLPDDAPLGVDVKPLVGLDEAIFDISLTANRPDCQSMVGMAREIAAILKKPFKMPDLSYTESGETIPFDIRVEAPDLCPRYIGHFVSDIKIEPSPAWMRRRLSLVGMNAISGVVDITNYVLKEFGQPMHAFDYDFLQGGQIIVRRAKDKEEITTLNEKEYVLSPENLVICDGARPVALAGVMGGLNSEIRETTKGVLFESAKFARDSVRRTARGLGQTSDASARYEKGVDEYSTVMGMKRALHLIEELGAGKVSSFHKEIAVTPSIDPKPLTVSLKKIDELLGICVPREAILVDLAALNFEPKIEGDALSVMVPAYREDIEGHEQDIAEEIIRSYGYEHIEPRFLNTARVTDGGRNEEQKTTLKIKTSLVKQGYSEAMFYSFFSPKDLDLIRLPEDAPERQAIRIRNPISEDLSLMRTTLAPSMIHAAVRNLRRGNTEGRFFEVAKRFIPKSLPLEDYPEERESLCICAFGDQEDFFTAKGAAEAIARDFRLKFTYEKAASPYLHPGMTAAIYCGDVKIGQIGKLSYEICEELAVEKPIFVTEIDLSALRPMLNRPITYQPISKFVSEMRDLALVMDEEKTSREVEEAIASSCKFITSVKLFDVYRAEAIGSGKKSMAYQLTFTPTDHEFTSEEIDKYIQKILRKLSFTLGIELR